MIQELILKVVNGDDLAKDEMADVFRAIMEGKATPAQMAAFLTALRMKGETVDEITAAAKIMREKMIKIDVRSGVGLNRDEINQELETILDTCGTGGSGTHTFNISTATAFVVAGCGVKVAKHGNRSASSQCGSADVLEALGIDITMSPKKVEKCVKEIGIGFLYAPSFHPAMKNVATVRKEMGIRTIFNILGPLCSPASANTQVLGVYDVSLVEVIANVLKNLGTRKAFVVHGLDTIDEISITGPTFIGEVSNSRAKVYTVRPEDFGVRVAPLKEIVGGDAKTNAEIIKKVLSGERGARRDVVLINASAALICANKAKTFKQGVKLAEEAIDSGKALEKLEKLRNFK